MRSPLCRIFAAAFLVSIVRAEAPRDFLGDRLPAGAVARVGVPRSDAFARRRLAWSRDGRAVVLLRADGIFLAWDADSGRRVRARRLGKPESGAVDLNRDGTRAAIGTESHVVVVETETGRVVRRIEFAAGAVALSPDGTTVAAGNGQRRYEAWSVETGARLWKSEEVRDGSWGGAPGVRFSGDGKLVLWDGTPSKTLATRLADGVELGRSPGSAGLRAVSHDGKLFVSGSGFSEHAQIVALPEFQPVHELEFKGGWGSGAMAFSPDDRTLAWCIGGEIDMFDVETGRLLWREKAFRGGAALEFSPDGRFIACADEDCDLVVFDVDSKKEKLHIALEGEIVQGLAFSPDGTLLAVADQNFSVTLADAGTGAEAGTLGWKGGCPLWVEWSPDGRFVASGGYGPVVRVQEHGTWREIFVQPYVDTPGRGEWSHDSRRLLAWEWGRPLRIVDLETRSDVRTFEAGRGPAAWSPDGKTVASAGTGREVLLWDAETGEKIRELRFHLEDLSAAAFSPDSRYLVTASRDRTVRLWDAATGVAAWTFRGHTRDVDDVAFTPDGRHLVTGSSDGTARIVETVTGRECARFKADGRWCTAFALRRDGRRLAVGSERGTTLVYETRRLRPSERGLDAAWADLTGDDAARAWKAQSAFIAAGEAAVAYLAERKPEDEVAALRESEVLEAIGGGTALRILARLAQEAPGERAKSDAAAAAARLEAARKAGER